MTDIDLIIKMLHANSLHVPPRLPDKPAATGERVSRARRRIESITNSKNISVETAHYVINHKYNKAIEVMAACIEFIDKSCAPPTTDDLAPLRQLEREFIALKSEYDMGTLESIGAFYEDLPGATEGYFAAAMGGNYSSRLNGLIRRIHLCSSAVIYGRHSKSSSVVKRGTTGARGGARGGNCITTRSPAPSITSQLYAELSAITGVLDGDNDIVSVEYIETHDDICQKCSVKMVPIAEISVYQCYGCGAVHEISGMAFSKSQVYRTDGAKLRTMRAPTVEDRHFKVWMERIQAIENKNIPHEDQERMRACFTRDGVRPKTDLTYALMRSYLQELRLTCYNEHTALLLKIFTGVSPPILTIQEHKDVSTKFSQVLELYKETEWRDKKPYYPYFIYKIIEGIFPQPSPTRKLLNYIHLQKDDTLKKKDLIFVEICRLGETRGLGIKASPTFIPR